MKAYILIVDDVVVQKQYTPAEGFVEVNDSVVCGQVKQPDGSFENPAPSSEQAMAAYEHAVQNLMDAAAAEAGYDDIKTAVTYAEEPAVARFQSEGQAFRAWRSLCWAYCYEQLAAVQAGQRTQPTVEAFIDELPVLTLPEVQ